MRCRLACSAFRAVFRRRQTGFGDLLAWLEAQMARRDVRKPPVLGRGSARSLT